LWNVPSYSLAFARPVWLFVIGIGCQVLHVHYDELSSFLVRHTEAELERQAQAVSRRRLMDWEQVCRPPHSPALVRHGGETGSLGH
jgi:hypothetical protein